MKVYKSKRIYLTLDKKKYCVVRVYPTKIEMQEGYKKFKSGDKGHYKVLGSHCGYEKFIVEKGKPMKLSPETGTVFLSRQHLGVGVVSHELMHAVIWAKTHKKGWKDQYPFVIKDMNAEEKLLHNLSYAVRQFYDWFWKKLDKPNA